jgi:hypothetical protein
MRSENGGDTLSAPIQTTEEVFNIIHAIDNYFYALNYSFRKQRAMYYQFSDIFSPPIDSADLGFSNDVYSYIDSKDGKYIIYENAQHRSYFIGKDIITSIKEELGNNLENYEIKFSVSPNPFNNSTILSFSLPKQGQADIIMYDINGKKVKEIKNYIGKTGENKIKFDAENLSSGAYILSLKYGGSIYSVKALLVK